MVFFLSEGGAYLEVWKAGTLDVDDAFEGMIYIFILRPNFG